MLYKAVESVEAEPQELPEASMPEDTIGHRHWLLERCSCWGTQQQQEQQRHEQLDAYITPEVHIDSHPAKGGRSLSPQVRLKKAFVSVAENPFVDYGDVILPRRADGRYDQSAKSGGASEEGPRGPADERHLQQERDVEQTRERLRERQLLLLNEREKELGSYEGLLVRCCGGPASGCSWALSFCMRTPPPTDADALLAEARRCASRAAIAGELPQVAQLYKEAQIEPMAGIVKVLRRVRDEERKTWLEYQQVTLFDNSVRLQWVS